MHSAFWTVIRVVSSEAQWNSWSTSLSRHQNLPPCCTRQSNPGSQGGTFAYLGTSEEVERKRRKQSESASTPSRYVKGIPCGEFKHVSLPQVPVLSLPSRSV